MAMTTGWHTPSLQAPPTQSKPQEPQLVLEPTMSPLEQTIPTGASGAASIPPEPSVCVVASPAEASAPPLRPSVSTVREQPYPADTRIVRQARNRSSRFSMRVST